MAGASLVTRRARLSSVGIGIGRPSAISPSRAMGSGENQ